MVAANNTYTYFAKRGWLGRRINIGPIGVHKVIIGKVNPLGKTLMQYFQHVKRANETKFEKVRGY